MGERPTPSITSYFASLEDPRSDHTRRHKLIDIMTIAICGVICGADSWVDLEIFGNSKEGWLKGFLELPNGIPSHDTFGRVFSLLDAQQFQDCFSAWVQAVCAVTRGQVIAIDGKTVRRSHDKTLGKSAIHMVSAWASEPESAIHDFNRELARSLAGNPDSPLAVVFLTSIIDEIVGVATDYADYHAISHWNTSALCSAKPGQWLSGQTSSITTTLPQFAQFLVGNRSAGGKATRLASA